MIQVKHVIPLRCKILRTLGFVSMSRMFARCSIGVKPYKGCKECENNIPEIFSENFQKGLANGLEDDKKKQQRQ